MKFTNSRWRIEPRKALVVQAEAASTTSWRSSNRMSISRWTGRSMWNHQWSRIRHSVLMWISQRMITSQTEVLSTMESQSSPLRWVWDQAVMAIRLSLGLSSESRPRSPQSILMAARCQPFVRRMFSKKEETRRSETYPIWVLSPLTRVLNWKTLWWPPHSQKFMISMQDLAAWAITRARWSECSRT